MKQTKLTDDLFAYWNAPPITPQLPVWRQLVEMVLLYFCRRIGPRYYLQGRWGRAEISFKHKWRHVNRSEYLRMVNRLNPLVYRKNSQHKLIEKSVLTLQKIPTPQFIGYIHALRGRSEQGHPIRNSEQLTKLLASFENQRVCFKPVEGFGGFGFASYLVACINGRIELRRNNDAPPISIEDWWKSNGSNQDGFLLESHLEQHAELAALHEFSVNTIRVWVALINDRPEVLGAFLRVGRNGSQVDNQSSGGIACPLNVDSGIVSVAIDSQRPGYPVIKHPNSQKELAGFQVPFWQDAKILAGEALAAFPFTKIAGLDIAITPTGPYLIELNVLPEYMGCAYMDLALKDKFDGKD